MVTYPTDWEKVQLANNGKGDQVEHHTSKEEIKRRNSVVKYSGITNSNGKYL
ncbi:MAG: hypothetical protein ACOX0A_05755 [Thermoguttaceae bacterium]